MATIPFFFSLVLFFWHFYAYKLQNITGNETAGDAGKGTHETARGADNKAGVEEEDEVIPVHFIDQAAIVRTSIINYTFRYNEVLDPAKLHRGLAHLVEMPGWNKLGGRLRAVVSDSATR
ncbi:hypothetical protein DHEL01_v208932 [Diaporthe helianthi]|uniref:Uncharacterized protein n=1 Tax=Diaporthe helianthi TaxID=158607 RepID=A0A2P5HR03_DIAHE|nr:hypothetical protein DHEL01_v208932 [Diaporthe helianthi]